MEIFSKEQSCVGGNDFNRKQELKRTKAKLADAEKNFGAVVTALMARRIRPAVVPQPIITAERNSTVQLSCESGGAPLTLCVWERNTDNTAQWDEIVIGPQGESGGGERTSAGITVSGNQLHEGKCGIEIQVTSGDDMGKWSCALMSTTGQSFVGEVQILDRASVPRIFATTTIGGNVKVLSPGNSKVETIINSSDWLHGIAVDMNRGKLYWTSSSKLFRSGISGTGIEILLDTDKYDWLWGLAYDEVTGNVYVASAGGFILACNNEAKRGCFSCVTFLTGQGDLRGIAVHPNEGRMYWTKRGGSIRTASMDGSNPTTLVSGLNSPIGIAVDYNTSRLYWADHGAKKIQSSTLDGRDVLTVAKVSSKPFGITVMREQLYWSLPFADLAHVETRAVAGGMVSRAHDGTAAGHLTSTDWTVLSNRTNPCDGKACVGGLCVLTPGSCRCVH